MKLISEKDESSRVDFQPGFSILVSCLVVSLILGVGVRIFFSEDRLRKWALSAVEPIQDKFDIELGAVRLSLADYWLPRISVELESLRVESVGCGPRHHISLGTVRAPLDFGSLLQGKIQFKTIEISDGQWIEGEPDPCEDGELAQKVPPKKSETKDRETTSSEPKGGASGILSYWKSISPLSSYLKSIRIQEFVFVPLNFGGMKIQTQDLRLSGIERTEGPILLKTNLQLRDVNGEAEASPLPAVALSSELFPSEIKGEIRGRWREGELKIDHSYRVSEGVEMVGIQFDFQNIPLTAIQQALKRSGWAGDYPFPKQFWVSFKGDVAGPVHDLATLPVRFEHCKFTGDLGEIESHGFSYHPHHQEPFSAMQVEMRKVDLKALLEIISVETPVDQYGAFGRLNGKLDYVSAQAMQFQGVLEGLELIFSNGGIRRSQIFHQIQGALEVKDQRFSALIGEASLAEGSFKGVLSFNFGHNFSEGLAQIRVDELSFSPTVQKLMVGGKISPFAVYGQIQWENGEIAMWRGDLAAGDIDGGDWQLRGTKVGGLFQKNQAEIKLQAEGVSIRKGSQIFGFLQPLFLDQEFEGDFLNMVRFSTKILRTGNSLQWQRATAFVPEGRITLSSEGGWDENDQISGWISSDFPELKLLKWTLGGNRQNPRILPHTKWLKELARKKQERPKTKTLTVTTPPKVESEGLEKIGKAVIQGAKELLGDSTPPESTKENPADQPQR